MKIKNNRKNAGFTLVEILISALLFFIIILIATSSFGYTIAMKERMDRVREMQQAGQYAINLMIQEMGKVDSEHCVRVIKEPDKISDIYRGQLSCKGSCNNMPLLLIETNDVNKPLLIFGKDLNGNLSYSYYELTGGLFRRFGELHRLYIPKNGDNGLAVSFDAYQEQEIFATQQSYFKINLTLKTDIKGRDETIQLNSSYTTRQPNTKCMYLRGQ